jgi:Holliday junction resolvase RusA-like endonuclease
MDPNQENVTRLMNESPERVRAKVAECINVYKLIRWKTVSFVIPANPIPSHRPRLSGYRVYVPGAAKNQSFFNKHVLPTLNGLFITTPCKIRSDVYVKTPKSFSMGQKILAEMRILRPWGNIGDVDNFEKAIYDQMQPNEKRGHVGIMSNDSLIIEAHTNKYYSMTPRTEVSISFMGKIPEPLKKVLRLQG